MTDDPKGGAASAPDYHAEDGPATAALQARDPFQLAADWLAEAARAEINDPEAMSLATVGPDGLPDVRMVLLKEIEPTGALAHDPRGAFVFYTNYNSAKGAELAACPQAALVLHWKSLRRQLRARGRVEKVSAEQADAYYATRSYKSRIGAWASPQSQPIGSRTELLTAAARLAARYPTTPPRPPHWGGFRILPSQIEFWSDGAFRLHDRVRWSWTGAAWETTRLAP